MYSKIQNVNILTSLLVAHRVRYAVVCPGSRNAPLIHNLNMCEKIKCYPVTDERSAGFFALGIALSVRMPVAVCVTSGTALLNLAPAVAEAAYQHLPLIVISADRPEAWIGQLDGQTMPQPGTLSYFVNKTVTLPSNTDDETNHWFCNRLVNEALLAVRFPYEGPVHINIPITEPLFDFTLKELPKERIIRRRFSHGAGCAEQVAEWWLRARRPMIIIGQCHSEMQKYDEQMYRKAIRLLSSRGICLAERLCSFFPLMANVDEIMSVIGEDERFLPDLIVYCGDTVVSKKLKSFLRRAVNATTVMISPDGEVKDVSMHADEVVEINCLDELLYALVHIDQARVSEVSEESFEVPVSSQSEYHNLWQQVQDSINKLVEEYEPHYSQMAVVKYFEQQLEDLDDGYKVHYANSSAVRLANIYAGHSVYCNRGVNGIDGSLSTAAGFSAVEESMVFCVIGDLSFFYDQNALWNQNLKGNLRIILLNNGMGGIFQQLDGLKESPALQNLISGAHHTSAQGICIQNDIGYLHATNLNEMQMGIVRILTEQTNRPMLLEVFTDAHLDAAAISEYFKLINNLSLIPPKPNNSQT